MSQSDERKNDFGTRLCVHANQVSVSFYFKYQGRHSDFKASFSAIPNLVWMNVIKQNNYREAFKKQRQQTKH